MENSQPSNPQQVTKKDPDFHVARAESGYAIAIAKDQDNYGSFHIHTQDVFGNRTTTDAFEKGISEGEADALINKYLTALSSRGFDIEQHRFSQQPTENPDNKRRSEADGPRTEKEHVLSKIDRQAQSSEHRVMGEKPQTEDQSILREIVLGDFNQGSSSLLGIGANIGIGLIPIVGQIADARDTIAAIKDIWDAPNSLANWGNFGLAAIGWVPLAGDAIKGAKKVVKISVDTSGEVARRAGKEIQEQAIRKQNDIGPAERVLGENPGAINASDRNKLLDVNIHTTPATFRRNLTKYLNANPNHPLVALLDSKSGKLNPSSGKGKDEFFWHEHPEAMQAGHVVSRHTGAPYKIVIMTAYENQMLKSTVEGRGLNASIAGGFDVLIIDGLPISVSSAEHLVQFGKLSRGTFLKAMTTKINIDDL